MIVSAGRFGFAVCAAAECGARYDVREDRCPRCGRDNFLKEAWRNEMKIRKENAGSATGNAENGTGAENGIASAVERGRRHLEGSAGPTLWHCASCDHGWTGHSQMRDCPECGSRILEDVTERETSRAASGVSPESAPRPAAGRFEEIEIGAIQRSPDNPRKDFDQAKLEEMAATIRAHGVLEPLLVRDRGDREYVIAAGERRLRAAELAGLTRVPCLVRMMTDAQFAEIQLIENLQREGLNPIEEAEAFRRVIEATGCTQKELADKVGIHQSQISNRMRLLTLPPIAREAAASAAIGTKQAEILVPWAHVPRAIERVCKDHARKAYTLEHFPRELSIALFGVSRPVEAGQNGPPSFEITAELAARLDIQEVPKEYGKGTTPRAFNTKLWDKLQRAAEAAQTKEEERKVAEKKPEKAPGGATRAKAREDSDEVFGKKLWEWKFEFLTAGIAAALEWTSLPKLISALLWLSVEGSYNPRESLFRALGLLEGWSPEALRELAAGLFGQKLTGSQEVLRQALRAEFVDEKGKPILRFRGELEVCVLAEHLGVDLAGAPAAFDPEFLALWGETRLHALAARPVFRADKINAEFATRGELVTALLRHWPRGYVPPELASVDQDGAFSADPPEKSAAKKSRGKKTAKKGAASP